MGVGKLVRCLVAIGLHVKTTVDIIKQSQNVLKEPGLTGFHEAIMLYNVIKVRAAITLQAFLGQRFTLLLPGGVFGPVQNPIRTPNYLHPLAPQVREIRDGPRWAWNPSAARSSPLPRSRGAPPAWMAGLRSKCLVRSLTLTLTVSLTLAPTLTVTT